MATLPPSMLRALQHIHPGASPEQIEFLGGGWSSRLSVVVHDFSLVIKQARPGEAGQARARHEFAATQWASNHGLAPQPLWLNPADGTLVLQYWPGSTPWADCPGLAQRLSYLHSRPAPPWPHFVPQAAAAASLAELQKDHTVPAAHVAWLGRQLRGACADLEAMGPLPLRPCHNDLQPFNVVRGTDQALAFIDWEEAALAPPLWDLASWIVSLELPAQQHPELLQAYGTGTPQALAAFCTVAEVYFLAWGLLRPAWRQTETARLARWMERASPRSDAAAL